MVKVIVTRIRYTCCSMRLGAACPAASLRRWQKSQEPIARYSTASKKVYSSACQPGWSAGSTETSSTFISTLAQLYNRLLVFWKKLLLSLLCIKNGMVEETAEVKTLQQKRGRNKMMPANKTLVKTVPVRLMVTSKPDINSNAARKTAST